MKILFVDNGRGGHHEIYLENLMHSTVYQGLACLSGKNDATRKGQYVIENNPGAGIVSYVKWITEIAVIADNEQVDVIQFMHMDSLMKYFAFGFGRLEGHKIVVIYHHFWKGFFRRLSYIIISRKINFAVVHTQQNMDRLAAYGVKNVKKFEYPAFGKRCERIKKHSPIRILAFGSTRYDKGIDILLEALKMVKEDFLLYIVGKDTYFDKAYICEHITEYREKVFLDLRYVSDEEKEQYFAETDIVVLPYRRIFDGASGPLADGVIKEKVIIGPNHGSLKQLIKGNHIGYTFDSESPESLAKVITKSINSDFFYDEKAMHYKEYISPERMRKEYESLFLSITDTR